ncbi:DUF4259 domain-containing protein [Phaeocystidibacter marisrubri]|uniref:DUF4259 domain-containing protein n=2 Tax=Phaeocystidibacter marisrubri TaxID=1577780 RepID=A0A6L3ZK65_9FLAO|nr:DUF4259 domain-containing protein [Phaeocystidibacter marisrubri]
MGAWDYGIFDDDTAYDFFDEIESDAKGFFKRSFEAANESDYLDYDSAHRITVSAAYLDNFLNGTTYAMDCDEEKDISNVNLFRDLKGELVLDDLKEIARQALNRVISENSELNELWMENEDLYPKWKGNIEALISRLK